MQVLRHVLDRLDLQLNESKTAVVDARRESFTFLGFSFHLRRSRKSGKVYPHIEPAKGSIQRIRDRIKFLTHRRRTPVPLPQVIGEVNASLRGWSGYFHYKNSSSRFIALKSYVAERVRVHLRRRYKLYSRAQAYQRFPDEVLYNRLGLFKVPTTAGWKSAHARR